MSTQVHVRYTVEVDGIEDPLSQADGWMTVPNGASANQLIYSGLSLAHRRAQRAMDQYAQGPEPAAAERLEEAESEIAAATREVSSGQRIQVRTRSTVEIAGMPECCAEVWADAPDLDSATRVIHRAVAAASDIACEERHRAQAWQQPAGRAG